MPLSILLSPEAAKAAPAAAAVSAIQSASQSVIVVDQAIYSLLAVLLGLMGVFLARLVTIADENKRLKRVQKWSETGPLTYIGILIVAPLIWHYNIALPWAAMIGLGVGYAVRVILTLIGGAVTDVAKGFADRAAQAAGVKQDMKDLPLALDEDSETQHLLSRIDEADEQRRLPPPSENG